MTRTSSRGHCEAGPPLSAGGAAGDSKATPAPGPSASQVLTVLPPGPEPPVSHAPGGGGHSVCADTEWKWEFAHKGRPLGEFCSPAGIQGAWTGLSVLGSSTGPANGSKLGRSQGSAREAGRLGMDFTG